MRTITTALATATVAALLTAAPVQSAQSAQPGDSQPPSRPGSPMAFFSGKGHLELGWFAPTRTGSDPIRRYVVRWNGGDLVVRGAANEVTLHDLEPGSYRFRVRAVSRAGAGPWSLRSQTIFVR